MLNSRNVNEHSAIHVLNHPALSRLYDLYAYLKYIYFYTTNTAVIKMFGAVCICDDQRVKWKNRGSTGAGHMTPLQGFSGMKASPCCTKTQRLIYLYTIIISILQTFYSKCNSIAYMLSCCWLIKRHYLPIIPDPMMELMKLKDAEIIEPLESLVDFCGERSAVPSSFFNQETHIMNQLENLKQPLKKNIRNKIDPIVLPAEPS